MNIKTNYRAHIRFAQRRIHHRPVLLNEAIASLAVSSGKSYIDATVGGGGHTVAILRKGGRVLALDQDPASLEIAQKRLKSCPGVFVLTTGNFSKISYIAKSNGFSSVDGVLFDLGFASFQVEDPERGLSFSKDGPLDMRLSPSLGVTAADLVNSLPARELARLFFKYGEEPKSWNIARRIVERRKIKPFQTTLELAETVGQRQAKLHPATKIFQALRIAVNTEFENLEEGLRGAFGVLKSGGRIVVITFHSGEDRIVKRTFRKWEEEGVGKLVNRKPIVSTEEEVKDNPRARSAKLRVVEKNCKL